MNAQQELIIALQGQQHVLIQLEVLVVLVKLDILEMVSLVMVMKFFFFFFIWTLNITWTTFEKINNKNSKIDINECSTNNGGCHATLGTCTNTIGSFTCACISGYSGNGVTCNGIYSFFNFYFIFIFFFFFFFFFLGDSF